MGETSWRGNFRDGRQIIMKTYIRQIVCEVRRSVKLAKDLYWRYLAETSDIARSATRVHRPVCRAPHILAS